MSKGIHCYDSIEAVYDACLDHLHKQDSTADFRALNHYPNGVHEWGFLCVSSSCKFKAILELTGSSDLWPSAECHISAATQLTAGIKPNRSKKEIK